ncbi:thioesterase II family protein [Streptomyces sp. NPDC055709]
MPWTLCAEPRALAPLRLVCFPHAGGWPFFFQSWSKELTDFEVYSVCYPGRAEPVAEEPVRELVPMARLIAEETAASADGRRLVLFGHSMGAIVAYETARALEARDCQVDRLIVSGARAPQLMAAGSPKVPRGEQAVIETVTELGGTDPELLRDPDFRELLLPAITADFEMLGAYVQTDRAPLECAVTALVADADPRVTVAEAAAWRESTRGPFRLRTVPGGHFYLASDPPFDAVREDCGR